MRVPLCPGCGEEVKEAFVNQITLKNPPEISFGGVLPIPGFVYTHECGHILSVERSSFVQNRYLLEQVGNLLGVEPERIAEILGASPSEPQ